MKKGILIFCMIATLFSCGSKNEQWEYKVVKVAGKKCRDDGRFRISCFFRPNRYVKQDG